MYIRDRRHRGEVGKTITRGEVGSPEQDEFASCVAFLQDPMELAIFAKLRADKVPDGMEIPIDWTFNAESVFRTLQWAHHRHLHKKKQKNRLMETVQEIRRRYTKQGLCCMAVLVFFILWAAVAATHQLTQQVVPHSSGVLVATSWTAASGQPVAMGMAVEFHRIADFPRLPATTLRRLEQVAFWHQDSYHWYRVASVVRLGNSVSVTAQEGTVLHVDGSNRMVHLRRACCGEQLVESLSVMTTPEPLTNTTEDSEEEEPEGSSRRAASTGQNLESDWASYGLFSVLSQVPEAVGQ